MKIHDGNLNPRNGNLAPARLARLALAVLTLTLISCKDEPLFDPATPARGPGQFVGRDVPLNQDFSGGVSSSRPTANPNPPSDGRCDADCQRYCDNLELANPLDRALCPTLWGVGRETRPVDEIELCRRLYADLAGYLPSLYEIERSCIGVDKDVLVKRLIFSEDFVRKQRQRWADRLQYNDQTVNFERIYDADDVVTKTYRGLLRYDEMVHVMSAHPVLTRRFDSPGDRVEALFTTFLGRPPYENERADLAKLYVLFYNGEFVHPVLGARVPDSYIQHSCVNEEGNVDPNTQGACTSILFGYNAVILEPDFRAIDNRTFVENLTADEWRLLQTPGRIITTFEAAWEHAIAEIFRDYLGYDLATLRSESLAPMIAYLFEHHGDIRAAHYAVVTSQLYLQSADCSEGSCEEDPPLYEIGPLKQIDAEVFLDSILRFTGQTMGRCDFRLPTAMNWLEQSPAGVDLVHYSLWKLNEEGRLDRRYAELAQTLGGCPDNQTSARFRSISILNTATQESFVASLCNPSMQPESGVPASNLLPAGMDPALEANEDDAERIRDHQSRLFFARPASIEELDEARAAREGCGHFCTREEFARASCYALLTSSEMLFY